MPTELTAKQQRLLDYLADAMAKPAGRRACGRPPPIWG